MFVRDGSLMAQPFDAKRFELTGDALRIVEHVAWSANGRAAFG